MESGHTKLPGLDTRERENGQSASVEKKEKAIMRQRILILVVALAVGVSAAGTLSGQGSPCLICNRRAQGGVVL